MKKKHIIIVGAVLISLLVWVISVISTLRWIQHFD